MELIIYFSQFFLFHVISKQLLCHLRRPFCVLWVLVSNYFPDVLPGQGRSTKQTWKSYFCFVTDGKQHKAGELNIITHRNHHAHRGHTWHDYPWPWLSLTWLLYNLQLDDVPGAWFRKLFLRFQLIRKEIVSWMYNNDNGDDHDNNNNNNNNNTKGNNNTVIICIYVICYRVFVKLW